MFEIINNVVIFVFYYLFIYLFTYLFIYLLIYLFILGWGGFHKWFYSIVRDDRKRLPLVSCQFCVKGKLIIRQAFLVLDLFGQANSKTSFKQFGLVLVKHLEIVEFIDWLNLSLTGNLRVSNSFLEIWIILSSCRQYRMHVFFVTCLDLFFFFFLIFWVKLGKQADDE